MDNNSIFFTQKKFDEVWNRVTSSDSADSDTLKALMGYEYTDFLTYNALSKKYTGELRTRFIEMAKDESRHYRTLRARYYILTGDNFPPEKQSITSSSAILDALRNRYIIESSAYEGYLKAAEETKLWDLSELYRGNAADEKRHMIIVTELLGNILK